MDQTTSAVSDRTQRIDPKTIRVPRDERQRKVIDTSGLKDSIARNGLINPIVVDDDLTLIAGERRLASVLELGWDSVPVRFLNSIPLIERQIIELEENLKRKELDWRDEVRAVCRIHDLYVQLDPEWSQRKTADACSISHSWMSMLMRVGRDIDSPKLRIATSHRSAFNILARVDDRAASDAMSDILETGTELWSEAAEEQEDLFGPAVAGRDSGTDMHPPQADPAAATGASISAAPITPGASPAPHGASVASPPQAPGATATSPAKAAPPRIPPADKSILNVSFQDWVASYRGPKFNLIHCDFPYGVDTFAGGIAAERNDSEVEYDDSAEVYWELVELFCRTRDVFMAHSAHMMFWLSAQVPIIHKTLAMFVKLAPDLVFNPIPLVWVKSDGAGIIRDFRRKPKPIYEVCLFAAREDRHILKAVNNAYSSPTDRSGQPTAKPEPMLRHFMEMVVDEQTSILDPTCGSGTSLRAAESLRAKRVLGLERDPTNHARAVSLLRQFRTLRGG